MAKNNRTIVITGAGTGIGAAAAKHFVALGDDVILLDINAQSLADTAQTLGSDNVTTHVLDVADKSSVLDVFASIDKMDVLVNNAGVEHIPTPMHLVSDEMLDKNLNINVKGLWWCMQQALHKMLAQGQGNIINIASVAGLRSAPMIAAYSATKHAVIGITKSAAVEYARQNIRINAVCPSFIDTDMVRRTLSIMDEKGQRSIVGANPMKRLGDVDEIANAIVWLASDESSFMTGHAMTLDGGMTA
ncbi:glucose 1-dehydrogenase [Alteromonas sp. LMIT006]|uniref:SDR family NAD(P)-dependent oxidoreductase n=1 Tax=Alteromonadaceae TaxID=72275 RepID=UPI0020CA48CB|nr:glucose 1-dehydrogenase [Alteromonas sp. LMIT006]UTP72023.1 glucose 1-dehydrogenase [Alteromonas sp. LMIT006]